MLKLKQLYTLAVPTLPITEYLLRSDWFTEVPDLSQGLTEAVANELQAENRLQVRAIIDGRHRHSSASMHSIWFDGEPVMVVQDGGSERDEFSRRLVTDAPKLKELCLYLRAKLDIDLDVYENDVVDPDAVFFEEELFKFVGSTDHGAQYGYPCETHAEGFQMLPGAADVLHAGPADLYFVAAQTGIEMPTYLRRHLHVMEKVRPATEEELSTNPSVLPHYHEQGFTQFCWYRSCETPEGQAIVVI